MTKSQIQWTVGVVAGILGILATSIGLWSQVGWTTPSQHRADIESIEGEHVVSQQEVLDAIKESRDEWKCDEYDEELLDLLEEQEENDSVELRRQIEKIREKMEKLDCQRFEDFG